MGKITRRQKKTLVVLYTCNMFVLSSVALMPPFFPEPNMTKRLSATKSGIVFGIFRLTMSLACPIYMKYMKEVGPKFLLSTGVFTAAGTSILMGIFENIPEHHFVYIMSISLQILAALGTASVPCVIVCLIAMEFPETPASVFASTEAALSLSTMVAPFIADIMADFMGFELPFFVSGFILLLIALMVNNMLPDTLEDLQIESGFGIGKLLYRQPVILFVTCLFANGFTHGFFLVSLKHYLKPLHLTQLEIILMFVLNSAVYSCCVTCWGWLCDKKLSPLLVASIGAIFAATSFLLSSIMPRFTINHTFSISVISNILFGIANGALVVSTFSGLLREAFKCSLLLDIRICSLVAAIWNCCYCFGCFVGFTLGGALLDHIGYTLTAMAVAALHILIVCIILLYCICVNYVKKSNNVNREYLIRPINEDSDQTFYSCHSCQSVQ